jgi:hypothetical protein
VNDELIQSTRTLCEQARHLAASNLSAIIEAFASKASGEDVSIPHAKFLMDLLTMEPKLAVEKAEQNAKSADEPSAEASPVQSPFNKFLLDRMDRFAADASNSGTVK